LWVAGPVTAVYSFLTDAERTDGQESGRAGIFRGLSFCLRTLSFFQIGSYVFDM